MTALDSWKGMLFVSVRDSSVIYRDMQGAKHVVNRDFLFKKIEQIHLFNQINFFLVQ